MRSTLLGRYLLPSVLVILFFSSLACAQAPAAAKQQEQPAASAQKVTVEGVILKRNADSFTMRDAQGKEVTVVLSDQTQVKEKKANPFRGSRKYTVTQLLRGLNVEVAGKQSAAGKISADEIKVKDNDIRVASSVETRVDPIENRLTEVETKLVQSEQNAKRLSGQVEEVSAIANAARSAAKAAQDTGDQANVAAKDAARQGVEAANATARAANERISALDDFDVKSTTTIQFSIGNSTLTKEAKAQLDTLAEATKAEKGFMLEIVGFASSEGDPVANERLSQNRADAVVRYLTESHNVPLRRLVTPYGFGAKQPVGDNATLEGRKQNRRVEVKLLVNKALSASK
jgi:outer membrane protein OmpA-like peptidoglycan-associated protein